MGILVTPGRGSEPPIGGVVLAAGEGRRFGRAKALVELGGVRLVDRAVEALRDAGVDDVVVVTGPEDVDIDGARVVANPDWRTGMGSSLRVGLATLAEGSADAAVLMVVDTPGIGPEVVRRLVSAYREGKTVVVATYTGRRSNPALIGRRHWPEVTRLATGDVGARAFFAAHPDLVIGVECGDIADPTDVDTPDDLARFAT